MEADSATPLVNDDPKRVNSRRTPMYISIVGLVLMILIVTIVQATKDHSTVTQPSSEYLQLYHITDTEAVCNDGSQGAYYYMTSPTEGMEKTWVLFLSGMDLWCFSDESCDNKIVIHGDATFSTNGLDDQTQPDGYQVFDSNDPSLNPSFWDAQHVKFNYCSSDSWAGNAPLGTTSDKYAFMGDRILRSAVTDLLDLWDLADAEDIMIISSGPSGVTAVDTITTLITERCNEEDKSVPRIKVVTDSPWYVFNEPFTVPDDQCTTAENCPMDIALPLAYDYWRAEVHPDCLAAGYTWECLMAQYVAPYTTTPLMIGQYEDDSIQAGTDGAGFDDANTTEGEAWFAENRDNVYSSLEVLQEGSVFFVAGCLWHGLYFASQGTYELDGVTLYTAVEEWFYDRDTTTNRGDYCEEVSCNAQCPDFDDSHL